MEIKWLTQTSKNNCFKNEYANQNQYVITDSSLIKTIDGKEVVSNVAESLMFHHNYQIKIEKFNEWKLIFGCLIVMTTASSHQR